MAKHGSQHQRDEPTFAGSSGTPSLEPEPSLLSAEPTVASTAQPPRRSVTDFDLETDDGIRREQRRSKLRRRPNRLLRYLFWLVFVAGVGGGGYSGYLEYVSNIVSLEALDAESATPAPAGDRLDYWQPQQKGPLALDELHWCMREVVRVDVLGSLDLTSEEITKLAGMQKYVDDFCDIAASDPGQVAQAQQEIDAVRQNLVNSTRNDQLLLFSERNAQWVKSELVIEIQRHLAELGYDVGTPDGLYGNQTQSAIKAFERDSGIDPFGQASYELVQLLRAQIKQTKNS